MCIELYTALDPAADEATQRLWEAERLMTVAETEIVAFNSAAVTITGGEEPVLVKEGESSGEVTMDYTVACDSPILHPLTSVVEVRFALVGAAASVVGSQTSVAAGSVDASQRSAPTEVGTEPQEPIVCVMPAEVTSATTLRVTGVPSLEDLGFVPPPEAATEDEEREPDPEINVDVLIGGVWLPCGVTAPPAPLEGESECD